MKKYAVIVAGGTGTRMKSQVPKQFLLLDGVPIIVHTIKKFLLYDLQMHVIVVLPEQHIDQWNEISASYLVDAQLHTTTGGATRGASVMAGLALIEEEGLVAVHDAVRPFVSEATIAASFKSADATGSGVAMVDLKDSIRELVGDHSIARDRAKYALVQTPQTFRTDELKAAYELIGDKSFTDDASVYEAAGHTVTRIAGSFDNIKITTPEDLK